MSNVFPPVAANPASSGIRPPVANLYQLQNLDDARYPDSTTCVVTSLLDQWNLLRSSALPVDGITVVPTLSGQGQWVRKGLSNSKWQRQQVWYINNVQGNDENQGLTAQVPIKTWAELVRRTGAWQINATFHVYVVSNTLDNVNLNVCFVDQGTLYIHGPVTTLRSSLLTAATNMDHVTGQSCSVTESTLPNTWIDSGPSGISLLAKLLTLTSGPAAGAQAWSMEPLSAKQVRTSTFVRPDLLVATQTPITISGDEYFTIRDVVALPLASVRVRGNTPNQKGLILDSWLLDGATSKWSVTGGVTITLLNCVLQNTAFQFSNITAINCLLLKANTVSNGTLVCHAGGLTSQNASDTCLVSGTGGNVTCTDNFVVERSRIVADSAGVLTFAEAGVFDRVSPFVISANGLLKFAQHVWGANIGEPILMFNSVFSSIIHDTATFYISNLANAITAFDSTHIGRSFITMLDQDTTVLPYQYGASILIIQGSLTAPRKLLLPLAGVKQPQWTIFNNTTGGQSLDVMGVTGTGVTVPNNSLSLVTTDGFNFYPVSGSGGGLPPSGIDPNNVLFGDGSQGAIWHPITADNVLPAFVPNIALVGANVVEVGFSVVNPQFNLTYTGGPSTSATLGDDAGNPSQNVQGVSNPVTRAISYAKNANNGAVAFILTASKNSVGPRTASINIAWQPRVFWGVGSAGQTSAAFIHSLANFALCSTRAQSFVQIVSNQKLYYASPTSYGAVTFMSGGFPAGFNAPTVVSVTNTFGVTQNYNLYESTQILTGSIPIVAN